MTYLSRKAHEIAASEGFRVSLEVFPARTEAGLEQLRALARRMRPFAPEYISVTYGAGGSSREATLDTIGVLKEVTDTPIAGHLTCANASRTEVLEVAEKYRAMGVDHIVALRGDPQQGAERFEPHKDGFANAAELTEALRAAHPDLRISVAAYPEIHPESPSRQADLENLKTKLDAGADEALTQFFFDNDVYRDFLSETRAMGIDKPIVPGIMLMHDFFKIRNFARRCQSSIPPWLEARFAGPEMDEQEHRLLTASYAIEQVLDLAVGGVRRFHLYTMNRPEQAEAVCRVLGLTQTGKSQGPDV